MRKFVSFVLSKARREVVAVDSRYPSSYLLMLVIDRFFRLIRGLVHLGLRPGCRVLLGRGSRILAPGLLHVSGAVSIGRNCYIDCVSEIGVRFESGVSIGDGVSVRASGSLGKLGRGLSLGANVGVAEGCFFGCAGGIRIGQDTLVGNFVSFHSENHLFENPDELIRKQGVISKGIDVGANCWIGAKSTILDGVSIGDGCVVAAGAVVVAGDYAPKSILAGVPAKVIRSRGTERQ